MDATRQEDATRRRGLEQAWADDRVVDDKLATRRKKGERVARLDQDDLEIAAYVFQGVGTVAVTDDSIIAPRRRSRTSSRRVEKASAVFGRRLNETIDFYLWFH